ncbi:hydrolase [Kitasatospora sp. NPDC054939]
MGLPRRGALSGAGAGADHLGRLPAHLRAVPYAGARYPGSPALAERPGLAAGANCQTYAYAVLAHAGLAAPPLRSSELWTDRGSTVRVAGPRPYDLVLYNAAADPYGAHVGVWLGEDAVLHLCAEVGRPAVWTRADFAERERYRVLVGFKRVTARTDGPAEP